MNFYVVFVKNRKKFDKYVKINKVRNKAIIDIKQQLEEHGIDILDDYKDYFNLLIYTKIIQTFRKNRDVYYIPNLNKIKTLEIDDVAQIKENLGMNHKFNLLLFFEDFKDSENIGSIISNMNIFDAVQIISDY
jgi:tRNA G18 (ribose-2'-O)-methylase SpoU